MTDFKNMKFKISRECDRGFCHQACGRQDKQLNTYDWLADVPGNEESTDLVEVQFKNTQLSKLANINFKFGEPKVVTMTKHCSEEKVHILQEILN